MNVFLWIKKNPKKAALIATGLAATAAGAGFMIFLIMRNSNRAAVKKGVKEVTQETKPGKVETSSRVSSSKLNRPLKKFCGRNPCELRTEEYKECLRAFLKQPKAPGVLERLQDLHSQMLQACPAGLPPFDVSVVGEFEKHLEEKLSKRTAKMSDFEEIQKKLEAVKRLLPTYEPIKSLETQFAEKFGPEFFRSLDRLDKTSEPAKVAKEVKILDRTHPFAKKHLEIDPAAPSHPSLAHKSFTDYLETDDTPKNKEILNIVNAEAAKEPVEQPQTTEEAAKTFLELKKSFDAEMATEIKLEDIFDFDINEHQSNMQDIQKSIATLDAMSKAELQAFFIEQKALEKKAEEESLYAEFYGHSANQALAELLLQSKPATVKQATFDAWKAAGFTAGSEYINLVRECRSIGPPADLGYYPGHLSDISKKWNESQGAYLMIGMQDFAGNDKHYANKIAIPFIFRGITHLRPEHSTKFEAAMLASSVEDMRVLAREVVQCGYYSEDLIDLLCETTHFDEQLAKNKTARVVMSFGEEVKVFHAREDIKRRLKDLKTNYGIEPSFGAALENRDASLFVSQFREHVAKGKPEYMECAKLVEQYDMLYYHLSHLEQMSDKEVKINIETRDNILNPAMLLFNAEMYLEKEDTPDFLNQLKAKGLASYEDAVKESGKLKLRQDNFELYKKLRLIEKCRDYVRHSNDFAYIKDDFEVAEKCVLKDSLSHAYHLVDKIVQELVKPLDEQKCSFDMTTKKLRSNNPKLKETLVNIYKDREAAELLTQLIRNAVSMNSLPNALHIYKAISKAYHALENADYSLFVEIHPNNQLWGLA